MDERAKIGDIRPSQLITTFGPGSIVDLPDLSVMIAGLDKWNKKLCNPISETRLITRLKIDEILAPPTLERESRDGTLPAFRFPAYMVCPVCRKLAPHWRFADPKKKGILYCHHNGMPEEKNGPNGKPEAKVFPVRFMVVCPRGHIDDFPWKWYVHRGAPCPQGEDSILTIDESGASGSIRDVVVRCSCNPPKGRSLADAFAGERNSPLGSCGGHRPWLGRDESETCDQPLRAMLRGASNAYFPIVQSALSIPPYTAPAHEVLPLVVDQLTEAESLADFKSGWKWMPREVRDLGFTPEQLWEAWQQKQALAAEAVTDLLFPEYEALLSGSQPDNAYEFETFEQEIPDSFKGFVGRLVQVRRLREVRVLAGFTRVDPPNDVTTMMDQDATVQSTSTRAPLGLNKGGKRWLPGVVVRGEGIFLTLNESRLAEWEQEKTVEAAGKALAAAYEKFCEDRRMKDPPPFPGVRYVLLHSLAHALMRQLGLNSGYSSTALRERIYSRNEEGEQMAGLLIYTASPDSEGSLGGLVDQGQTDRFGAALWQALADAHFCSGDPLCSEHEPKAHGDLNGAACHACQLAAETSCERSNRFLDRSFLVPTVSRQNLAFFNTL